MEQKEFNAKTDLYPYTHEYYFGFFKTKQMTDFIRNMNKVNPNIDDEYFSLKLYLTCLEHNLKPNKQSAYYLLQLEWRKLKKYPTSLKNLNLKELKEDTILDTNNLEEKCIKEVNNINTHKLYEKIMNYVEKNCKERQKQVFKLYFLEGLRMVDIQKRMNFNSRQAVDTTLTKLINKIKNKFGVEYKRLKLDD